MGALGIAYLFVALGAGLIGWKFLQSSLKVRKLGGPATMGFLFSGIFLLLAIATALNGILQIVSARALFVGATLSLVLAGLLSLLLVRYVLSLKTPLWHVFFLSGFWGVFGVVLATLAHAPQTLSVFLFILYAIALTPLFFVFHHYFLLSRYAETKTKSFWLMILMPVWLAGVSFSLALTPLLALNTLVSVLAMSTIGIFLLLFVVVPVLRFHIAKPKIFSTSFEITEFLNAF